MSDFDGGVSAPAAPVAAPHEAPANPGVQPPQPIRDEPLPAPEPDKAEPKKESEKPVSTRDALAKARDKVEAEAKAADASKPKEPARPEPKTDPKPEPDRGPARAEDGKFVPRDGKPTESAKLADETKPAEAPAQADPAKPAPETAPKPSTPASDAPARFSAEAKTEWASAPERVKAETHRAITELTQGLEKYKGDAEAFGDFREFHALAKQHGVNAKETIGKYVSMEQLLARDPMAGYEAVARNMGHTFRQVAEAYLGRTPDQAAAANDATIKEATTRAQRAEAENAQLKQQLAGFQKEVETRQTSDLQRQVEEFSGAKNDDGSLKHPRFEELKGDIAHILAQGMRPDLPGAYKLAARWNDDGAANASIQIPVPATPPAPVSDPAAQTRKGSASITGAPTAGSDPVVRKGPPPSIKEALKRATARAS